MTVELNRAEEFAVLTLNRPERLNALSYETIRDIAQAFDEVERSDARAIIITGKGERAFCAGADINEIPGRSIGEELGGTRLGQETFARLDRFAVPSIALVNGYALGGGCELAMACTFRLATANARFGLPEVKLGLVPGYGGTQRLPRLIGLSRALEIMMTGRQIDAHEAVAIGLVSRIVQKNDIDEALNFGREFSRHSLLALRLIRDAAQRGLNVSLTEGLKIEADLSTLSMESKDGKEGLAAFIEKRPARFTDR